jgi:hypothetical protein
MNSPGPAIFGPHFVLGTDGSIHGEDTLENRELVRRIEACMRACAEISTEELEAGIIQDMCRAVAGIVPILQSRPQPSEGVRIRAIATEADVICG